MTTNKKGFSIGKKSTAVVSSTETPSVTMDDFVAGKSAENLTSNAFAPSNNREVTKTFRLPEDLAHQLKMHAVMTRQTEKDILVKLVTKHMQSLS